MSCRSLLLLLWHLLARIEFLSGLVLPQEHGNCLCREASLHVESILLLLKFQLEGSILHIQRALAVLSLLRHPLHQPHRELTDFLAKLLSDLQSQHSTTVGLLSKFLLDLLLLKQSLLLVILIVCKFPLGQLILHSDYTEVVKDYVLDVRSYLNTASLSFLESSRECKVIISHNCLVSPGLLLVADDLLGEQLELVGDPVQLKHEGFRQVEAVHFGLTGDLFEFVTHDSD